jgi:hypothetical protein
MGIDEDVVSMFGTMGNIDAVVAGAIEQWDAERREDGEMTLDDTLRVIGLRVGRALLQFNADGGHEPGWVSKKAADAVQRHTHRLMGNVNITLGVEEGLY